jgi:large subunit ribosomal protein L15
MKLNELENVTRPYKRRKRLGRGIGSKSGKTCGRGVKGAGSRSGWKSRARYEGGQLPLYRKLPERGFSNARFAKKTETVNLGQLDETFEDGEVVSLLTLRQKGFLKSTCPRLKILGNGEISKRVTIEAHSFSAAALEKITAAKIEYRVVD